MISSPSVALPNAQRNLGIYIHGPSDLDHSIRTQPIKRRLNWQILLQCKAFPPLTWQHANGESSCTQITNEEESGKYSNKSIGKWNACRWKREQWWFSYTVWILDWTQLRSWLMSALQVRAPYQRMIIVSHHATSRESANSQTWTHTFYEPGLIYILPQAEAWIMLPYIRKGICGLAPLNISQCWKGTQWVLTDASLIKLAIRTVNVF